MALIPLNTAQRVTQSPLETVNARLMQLVALKEQEEQRVQAVAMGRLKADLMKAQTQANQALAAQRKAKALETLSKGLNTNPGKVIESIMSTVATKLKSNFDANLKGNYDQAIKSEMQDAARNFLAENNAYLRGVADSIQLDPRPTLNDYTDKEQASLAKAALGNRIIASKLRDYQPRTTMAGVQSELIKSIDVEKARDDVYNFVMKEYGSIFSSEDQKQKLRDALNAASAADLASASPSAIGKMIGTAFTSGAVEKPEGNLEKLNEHVSGRRLSPEEKGAYLDLMVKDLGMDSQKAAETLIDMIQGKWKPNITR